MGSAASTAVGRFNSGRRVNRGSANAAFARALDNAPGSAFRGGVLGEAGAGRFSRTGRI